MNKILIIGIGGGGNNAVKHHFISTNNIVDFALINTDEQSLSLSHIQTKLLIGKSLTEGKGAGSKPSIGKAAAEESEGNIKSLIQNYEILILVAGLGGGTGTGTTPVVARIASEMNILTISVVTSPFTFEGRRRAHQAKEGLEELKKYSDSTIVIQNDNLRQITGNLSMSEAFSYADEYLMQTSKCIISFFKTKNNYDFQEIKNALKYGGIGKIGYSKLKGHDRAEEVMNKIISSPFININGLTGSSSIFVNIRTSNKFKVLNSEINYILNFINQNTTSKKVFWNNTFDDKLGKEIEVTIIATGFEITNTTKVKHFIDSEKNREKNSLVLYLLEEEYSQDEIVEIISFLGELYTEIGGDQLIIKGMDVFEYEPILQPI